MLICFQSWLRILVTLYKPLKTFKSLIQLTSNYVTKSSVGDTLDIEEILCRVSLWTNGWACITFCTFKTLQVVLWIRNWPANRKVCSAFQTVSSEIKDTMRETVCVGMNDPDNRREVIICLDKVCQTYDEWVQNSKYAGK